jgi:hypothetical protein
MAESADPAWGNEMPSTAPPRSVSSGLFHEADRERGSPHASGTRGLRHN